MTEPTPAFYSIEKLLEQSVQPFPDLPPDEFEILKQSIKDRGLLNPILLTADGYLFDGHQRLKAMLALNRKRISAESVKVMMGVTRDNMLGNAYASNMVRRMLSTADKAARMHACVAMGWSQRKIAKEFSMSQPAVSQLMAAYPPADGLPEVIITQGEDGKTYTRTPHTPDPTPPPPPAPPPKPRPFEPDGHASLALLKARRALADNVPHGLDRFQGMVLRDLLRALAKDCENFVDEYLTDELVDQP